MLISPVTGARVSAIVPNPVVDIFKSISDRLETLPEHERNPALKKALQKKLENGPLIVLCLDGFSSDQQPVPEKGKFIFLNFDLLNEKFDASYRRESDDKTTEIINAPLRRSGDPKVTLLEAAAIVAHTFQYGVHRPVALNPENLRRFYAEITALIQPAAVVAAESGAGRKRKRFMPTRRESVLKTFAAPAKTPEPAVSATRSRQTVLTTAPVTGSAATISRLDALAANWVAHEMDKNKPLMPPSNLSEDCWKNRTDITLAVFAAAHGESLVALEQKVTQRCIDVATRGPAAGK